MFGRVERFAPLVGGLDQVHVNWYIAFYCKLVKGVGAPVVKLKIAIRGRDQEAFDPAVSHQLPHLLKTGVIYLVPPA